MRKCSLLILLIYSLYKNQDKFLQNMMLGQMTLVHLQFVDVISDQN